MYLRSDPLETPAGRTAGRQTGPWLLQLQILVLIAVLAAPAFTPAASLVRVLFPLACLVFATFSLLRGDYRRYVSFCVWLFLLTPEVRRVVDLQAGWQDISTVMLTPYLCAGLSLGAIPLALTAPRHPVSSGLLLMTAAAVYGLLITPVSGTIFAGGYDFLRWVIPPCFGLMIAFNARFHAEIQRDLGALLILSLTLVGGYALYQFWYLPAWDAFWMKNAKMNSIGAAKPLSVRPFSTLNSPGSLAAFLMIGITMLVAQPGKLKWLALTIGTAALALTVVRAAWLGLAVVVLFYMFAAPLRLRGSVIMMVVGGILCMPLVLANDRASELVTERMSTFSDLSSDQSANDRLAAYRNLSNDIQSSMLGSGLGTTGVYAAYADGGRETVVDGGPIEIILKVGLIGAIVYFSGVVVLFLKLFLPISPTAKVDRSFVTACRAVALSALVLQTTSPTTVGEMGFFLWLFVGCGLAAILQQTAQSDVQQRQAIGATTGTESPQR